MSDTEHAAAATGTTPSVGVPLPGDNRIRVPDTRIAPYRWVGRLHTWWRDGSEGVGTATLIDVNHALTCAHNLYDQNLRWCTRASFSPAHNRTSTGGPIYDPWELAVAGAAVPEEYRMQPPPAPPVDGISPEDITEYLWDYGVVRLADIVPPELRNPMFQVKDGARSAGQTGTINGYSGDLDPDAHTQYTRTGTLHVDDTQDFVSYQMSTYHGDSGAAVYWQRPDRHYQSIAAVHVTGVRPSGPGKQDGLNFGPALNPEPILQLVQDSDGAKMHD